MIQKPLSGGVLKNFAKFTGKHLCHSIFLNKVTGLRLATLLKKETLTQMFSCAFCEIFKNAFFYRTPLVAASEELMNDPGCSQQQLQKQRLRGVPQKKCS